MTQLKYNLIEMTGIQDEKFVIFRQFYLNKFVVYE
jgi:hypothetical protein